MRSLLVIHHMTTAAAQHDSQTKTLLPEQILRSFGYQVIAARNEKQALAGLKESDGAVLHLPLEGIKSWNDKLEQHKSMPILWWCSDITAGRSLEACEDEVVIDGLLFPSMNEHELHWSLHFSSKHFYARQQWRDEKRQLQARIEERKWIDMAKGILCEMKNITESEAYDILRKQAMNERKRMVDVATSIVKLYQLLQESGSGGASKP
ncbi:ANTAR domain-containing response regulator [Paenibacillus lemnae]|uniref:ANTAR domain-containing protein n=1 Tax=Paenibacillus lemnae TaxID=1330551 RepID=A0A848M8K8_PAELE|nr:ANTAR domain-containing protein [Paenibacillus lemnae]NMO95844.1 ANTAR domain-containing protein [Paenibacillus lemnae]